MTDSHCHVSCGDPSVREFLIGRDFIGVHPWEAAKGVDLGAMREELTARPPNPRARFISISLSRGLQITRS